MRSQYTPLLHEAWTRPPLNQKGHSLSFPLRPLFFTLRLGGESFSALLPQASLTPDDLQRPHPSASTRSTIPSPQTADPVLH